TLERGAADRPGRLLEAPHRDPEVLPGRAGDRRSAQGRCPGDREPAGGRPRPDAPHHRLLEWLDLRARWGDGAHRRPRLPDDADAFVAAVATAVETLERRVADAEAKLAEAQARRADSDDADDSLRRTLVLAQRTADLAIQEAKDEAARVLADVTEQRESAE